jgi:PAS domain-containing protein
MKEKRKTRDPLVPAEFIKKVWEESWTYIRTVVDIVHEPILILDKDLRIIAANDCFYQKFNVGPKETEGKIIYDLGNGQWDIPALRKLLEDILPEQTFFKGFEVDHNFPSVGRKVMILNARQTHFKQDAATQHFPPTIFLAMDDVTDMMDVAHTLAGHAKQFETRLTERTERMETHINLLLTELAELKKR